MSTKISYTDYGIKDPHLLRDHNRRVMGQTLDFYRKKYKHLWDSEDAVIPNHVPRETTRKSKAAENKARALEVLADMESGKLQVDTFTTFCFHVKVSTDWIRHYPDIKERAKKLLAPKNHLYSFKIFKENQRAENVARANELVEAMESGAVRIETINGFCLRLGLSYGWTAKYPELRERIKNALKKGQK